MKHQLKFFNRQDYFKILKENKQERSKAGSNIFFIIINLLIQNPKQGLPAKVTTFSGIRSKNDNLFWNYTWVGQMNVCNAFEPPLCRLCNGYVTAL
jgi:hypothetical protein